MDQQMKENIEKYSGEIETIENFMEAVRQTVGQYLGYIGNKGFINMVREILQNAIDELMKDASPCNHIIMSYDERTHETIVEDNGRGIPFDNIIRIFAREHTSSNYSKRPGEFSSGRHGVGSKVTNAVSSEFNVESYVLGKGRRVEFKNGCPWDKGEVDIPNPNNKQGTVISFKPSYDTMGEITTSYQEVLGLVITLLPLLKIGAVIDFNGIDSNGNIHTERLVNQDGIITDLINKTTSPLIKPIVMSLLTDNMKADIAFTYDSNDLMVEHITSFSNFCPTTAGTHVDGFIDGLTRYFREYMNKIYLKSSKLTIVNNDIKTGLKAIVAVAHLKPIFTGQAKEVLSNDDMFWFVRDLVKGQLEKWTKENPNELQKLCKYFKDVAEIRVKSDGEKIKLSKTYQSSTLTGLPAKYKKPNGKNHLELVILEGDSALGSAQNSRCHERQGLFPIRGKIPNAFTTERKKFLNNEEINGMIAIFGGGFGKDFDLSKVQWEKIIIMADADPDGNHIRTLLLKFILVYCLPLILDGRVYGAVPPLFGIKMRNGKHKYFIDRLDFIRYIQTKFSSENDLRSADGSNMTTNEIINVLYSNMEYVYDLELVSNTYAINPSLLEMCIANRDKDFNELKRILKANYRFLDIKKENGIVILDGLVESKYHTVVFNDKLLSSCSSVFHYIDESPKQFMLNEEKVSLYNLMKRFDAFKPSGITRYKGIGEMDEDQLAESALHPDSDRTLIRYTVDDIKKEIEAMRYIESNKSELLKDIKVCKADVM